MNRTGRDYDDMTLEELQREAWETLIDTDVIDGPLTVELEKIREALNRKRPVEYLYTPEESWERFLERCADEEEIAPGSIRGAQKKAAASPRRYRTVLRTALVAAVVVALLAGATFAAGSFGYDLWAWVPRWNASAGRFEPAAAEVPGKPVPAILAELGITDPVYPAHLPEGFVITESHISKEPLLMVEQYARGNERLSITVTPVRGVKSAVYQKSGMALRELQGGRKAHFAFENEGTITAISFTGNYATYISGDLTVEEITGIILSIGTSAEGGDLA